jgi:hypothetical protein
MRDDAVQYSFFGFRGKIRQCGLSVLVSNGLPCSRQMTQSFAARSEDSAANAKNR